MLDEHITYGYVEVEGRPGVFKPVKAVHYRHSVMCAGRPITSSEAVPAAPDPSVAEEPAEDPSDYDDG